jgi:phosphopantetheine adenylyltransferase
VNLAEQDRCKSHLMQAAQITHLVRLARDLQDYSPETQQRPGAFLE